MPFPFSFIELQLIKLYTLTKYCMVLQYLDVPWNGCHNRTDYHSYQLRELPVF